MEGFTSYRSNHYLVRNCYILVFSRTVAASSEMLLLGIPALRIISISFVMSAITILCGYFSSGLGNGIINMVGAAIRQLILLVPCQF